MIKLFIFNNASRAAGYGIGTYVRQLAESMSSVPGYDVSLIEMCADVKDFETAGEAAGIRRFRIPGVPSGNEEEQYLRSVFYFLTRHIDMEDGDRSVFHFNYYQHLPLARLLKGWCPGCRIILTVHYFSWCFEIQGNITRFRKTIKSLKDIYDSVDVGTDTEAKIRKYFGTEREFLHLADGVVALSANTMKLLMEDYGVSADKTHLIYNGLEDTAAPERGTSAEYPRDVVFVGRLDRIKGQGYLINAFANASVKYPDARLLIAGEGDFNPYMRCARKACGRILFLGKMEHDELEALYRSAYMGVLPSFHEQCSYTAIEMMRHGVPFIGTDSTGLGEMLDTAPELRVHIDEEEFDGDGFTDGIASRMDLLLGDRELRDMYSERFRSLYDERHRAADMVGNYRAVVSSAFRREGDLSPDYLDHLDHAMMSLIDRRPEIDTEVFGMSGIGIYLWWRATRLKGKESDGTSLATVMEYLVYYMDWLEEAARDEGLPNEMSLTLADMDRHGFCRPAARRLLEAHPPLADGTAMTDPNEIITNALRICNCKV